MNIPTVSSALKSNCRSWCLGVVGLGLLLVACAHPTANTFKPGTGDAGNFILRQSVARGGHLINTNGWPAITGDWQYSEDQFGVIIRLSRNDYAAVEQLLNRAFGQPSFGPSETTDGGRLGGYRLTPQGGAIQFGYDAQGTQVIILRQLTAQEFYEGLIRAAKELGTNSSP